MLSVKNLHAKYGGHLKCFGMTTVCELLATGAFAELKEKGKALAALGAEALLCYANQHTNVSVAKSILGEVLGRISGDLVEEGLVDKVLLARGRAILG